MISHKQLEIIHYDFTHMCYDYIVNSYTLNLSGLSRSQSTAHYPLNAQAQATGAPGVNHLPLSSIVKIVHQSRRALENGGQRGRLHPIALILRELI